MRKCFLVLCLLAAVIALAPRIADAVTYFAQFTIGGGYEAILFIVNPGSSQWDGKIRVRCGNDQRWQGGWSVNGQSLTGFDAVLISIAPHGTGQLVFRGDSTVRSGFIELEGFSGSYDGDVALGYFYRLYQNGELISTTGSPKSELIDYLDDGVVFPVEESSVVRTGYALAPWLLTSTTYPVTLTLVDQVGIIVGSKTVTFTGHMAEFVSQRFPTMPIPFIGHLKITMGPSAPSLTGVAVEVLRMEMSKSRVMFTSTPADYWSLVGNTGAYYRDQSAQLARVHRDDLCRFVSVQNER